MRKDDEQFGIPYTELRDTKSNIEDPAKYPPNGGMVAYASDTGESGHYDDVNNVWVWGGGGGLTNPVDVIEFNTGYTPTDAEPIGSMFWSDAEQTLQVVVEGGTLDVNKEIEDTYFDSSVSGLSEGDIVSVVGISGNRQAVDLTDATSSASASACIGMVTNVNLDGTVRITKLGRVRKLSTGGMTEGMPIYVDPANKGAYTQTPPASQYWFIHIGVVEVAQINNGVIDIDIRVVKPYVQSDIDEYKFGFVTDYAATQQTTITFDGTNTFTIAPTAPRTTWEYYRNGIKYTITGSKTCKLAVTPPAVKGSYSIYIDSTDGTLTCSSVSTWNLQDEKVPLAVIVWDNALTPKYWLADERHSASIPRRYHFEHHFADGTEIITAPILTGYSVAQAVPTDAHNTFKVAQSVIQDEDLNMVIAELADGDGTNPNYIVDFPASAGVWNWEKSIMPYRYTAGVNGIIQYNAAGTMTQGSYNKFYTTYFLLTNRGGDARITQIHGNAEYSTLAAAQAETFASVYKTGISIAEFVACFQFVWDTSNAYNTKGKCRLAAEPKVISVSAAGVSAGGSVNAAAVSFTPNTPTGTISATNVQGAIEELDAEKEKKLTNANIAPTTADQTATVWTRYFADISGLTADRNFILPTPAIGDIIELIIAVGDPTYTYIIKGAASTTINSGSAATEWSRLFISGEMVRFVANSATNWQVMIDGRIPCVAQIKKNTGVQYISNITVTTVTLGEASIDNGCYCSDTANNKILIRRAGNYIVDSQVLYNWINTATLRNILQILKNAEYLISLEMYSPIGGYASLAPVTLAPLAIGDGITLITFQDSGGDKIILGYPIPTVLGVIEVF